MSNHQAGKRQIEGSDPMLSQASRANETELKGAQSYGLATPQGSTGNWPRSFANERRHQWARFSGPPRCRRTAYSRPNDSMDWVFGYVLLDSPAIRGMLETVPTSEDLQETLPSFTIFDV
jgi:hypothetical protein